TPVPSFIPIEGCRRGREVKRNPPSVPMVGIVTPVYNGAKYLAETMECVQALDYTNLVHVINDNCSSDETPSIIDSFRNRGVKVVCNRLSKTIPMADNWNEAVRLVPEEARYFWLLCADDLLKPDAIAKTVRIAESAPSVSVVGCQWTGDSLCGTEL